MDATLLEKLQRLCFLGRDDKRDAPYLAKMSDEAARKRFPQLLFPDGQVENLLVMRERAKKVFALTDQQAMVLVELVGGGRSNDDIAVALGLGDLQKEERVNRIKGFVYQIFGKIWDVLEEYPGLNLTRKQINRTFVSLWVKEKLSATDAGEAGANPPAPTSPTVHWETEVVAREFGYNLVGRADAMSLLTAYFDAPGDGGFLLIQGEQGSGKSRILWEICKYAEERKHFAVRWGRCEQGVSPLFPWRNIAEQAGFQLQPDSLDLFVSQITDVVHSGAEGLVIVLDNLNYADTASLLMLRRLLSGELRPGVLVIGTAFDGPLPTIVDEIRIYNSGSPRVFYRNVELKNLILAELIDLTQEIAECETLPATLANRMLIRTSGNPFFVTKIAEYIKDRGGISGTANIEVDIPADVTDAIYRRLPSLSQGSNRAYMAILAIAALIGQYFEERLLMMVLEREEIKHLVQLALPDEGRNIDVSALDKAEMQSLVGDALTFGQVQHLIEPPPSGLGYRPYRFVHDLAKDSISGRELNLTLRGRVHLAIAEVLEAGSESRTDRPARAYEIFYHFSRAGALVSYDKLMEYAFRAADYSLDLNADEDAKNILWEALEITLENPHIQRTDMSLVDLFAATWGWTSDIDEVSLLGRLLVHRGVAQYLERGDADGARKDFDKALAISRSNIDHPLALRALVANIEVDWNQMDLGLAYDHCETARGVLASFQDAFQSPTLAAIHIHLSRVALLHGDLKGSQSYIREAEALTEALAFPNPFLEGKVLIEDANLKYVSGNLMEALDSCEKGLKLYPSDVHLLFTRALIAGEQDTFDIAEIFWNRLIGTMRELDMIGQDRLHEIACAAVAVLGPFLYQANADATYLDIARDSAHKILGLPTRSPLYTMAATAALGLIECLQPNDNLDLAKQYYDKLATIDNANMSLGGLGGFGLPLLLAHLEYVLGDTFNAKKRYKAHIIFCANASLVIEVAFAAYQYLDFFSEGSVKTELLKMVGQLAEVAGMEALRRILKDMKVEPSPDASARRVDEDNLNWLTRAIAEATEKTKRERSNSAATPPG